MTNVLDLHYVLHNRMVAWAQTWERMGYFEQNVSSFHDLFRSAVASCWKHGVKVRATDFHSPSASQDDPSGSGAVEKAWQPQRLYLNSWPSASQDDPSGPCADDQGLYTDGDLQDHWRAYIQSFPRREGKAMEEQLRNNTNHRIGIPLRRISRSVCLALAFRRPRFP